tara:strand:+ start:4662 stop:5528 length:867 start_codon:yes stop_codon:yes gene_type:complete
MTDDIEKTDDEVTVEEQGPKAGERLANARREKQIAILEIAKELHLDEPKLRALERNEFEVFGAPVFAKGHIRKYAQLVGISADDVMADYYELTRSDGMPPLVGKVHKPVREIRPGRWLLAILLIAIAAAVYWWFAVREVPESQLEQSGQMTLPQPAAPAPDPAVDDRTSETPVEEPVAEAAIDTEPATRQESSLPTPLPDPEPAAGEVQVSLLFSGNCWTEITDANGEQLFFDLGVEGRSVTVSGEAPLAVLFGDADNVSLRVNGVDYPIGPGSRRGRTARFTINNPS